MIKYYIKYFMYDGNTKFLKTSFLLPFLTVFIGCFVMMFSNSIMGSISDIVYNKISFFEKENSITINIKEINQSNSFNRSELIKFLKEKKYFFNLYQTRYMFVKNENSHDSSDGISIPVSVSAIDNFDYFLSKNSFSIKKTDIPLDGYGCVIGSGIASSLGLKDIDDRYIELSSVLDFKNLSMGSYPKNKFKVITVIDTGLPQYDNNIWIPLQSSNNLFDKDIFLHINLNKPIKSEDKSFLNIYLNNGADYHQNVISSSLLFKSIKYEKFIYSIFGLFIMFIASSMLMGFNMYSILNSFYSISLFQSMGIKRNTIGLFYFLNSTCIALLGFLAAYLSFQILILFDINFNLIDKILPTEGFLDFDLKLKKSVLLNIFLLNIVIIPLSTLYPIYKMKNNNIYNFIRSKN